MSGSAVFKKLFEPARIGKIRIRNRIVMPAMATGTSSEDGYVTRQTKDYYGERAKGGVGLIIVEFTCVDFPLGKGAVCQLAVDDDKYIPGLRELAQVIQQHGVKAALQLHHAGNAANREITQLQPVGPSAIARPGGEVPRELTISEIGGIINKFAKSAKRAKEAGFDGIEIHAAHAYLIAQFLSSAWNKRKDDYGGPLNNRARILLEILRAIKQVVGKSYPVWCRINGEETGIPNGFTLEEARELAKMLEKSGTDAISVSASALDLTSSRPHFYPPGWAAHLAAGVKKVVSVPVIAVGRIDPELGEQLLNNRKADFIAVGRALRADPELPNKVASGRLNDIRPCIACNACGEIFRHGGQRLCVVNAAIGREREYMIRPTKNKKKILIIGGGPAGMEAARVAALRGHEVILFEKGNRLGGKLLLAAAPPDKGEINEFTNFLANQIKKFNVRIELNTEVTPGLLKGYKPDVVILAAGAKPLIPEIDGVGRKNVVTAEDVLANKVEIGEAIAVLGGGRVGCEVAAFLVEKGKKVIIVEMLEMLAADLGKKQGRKFLLEMLAGKGVTMLTQVKGEGISDRGLIIVNKHGQKQTIEVDTIVLACGFIPNTNLIGEIRGIIPESYIAGDCVEPRTILEAVDDGARIGRLV